jgi:mRNA-degrading endonuclease RelE of RelBE toxin-antitoxin system
MAADVVLTEQARAEIKDLKNAVIAARIYNLIDRLKNWPTVSGVKALSGNLAGKYRMRTGDYRIQFRVETAKVESAASGAEEAIKRHTVIVEKAGHRDGFYED